jgi:putative oxidoreductase
MPRRRRSVERGVSRVSVPEDPGREPARRRNVLIAFIDDRWGDEPGSSERAVEAAGRALLSAMFVSGGLQAFKAPEQRAPRAAAIGIPFPKAATRLNGGAMVLAGVALASGVAVKPAAAVLAASLVPTTIAGHPFWKETDPKARAQQRIHFLKNVAMLGGLLVLLSKRR